MNKAAVRKVNKKEKKLLSKQARREGKKSLSEGQGELVDENSHSERPKTSRPKARPLSKAIAKVRQRAATAQTSELVSV